MQITDIEKVLDVTFAVRKAGKNVVPCFQGPAGIGKSQAIHQYCAKNNLQMRDLRLALCDASDFIGLPFYDDKKGSTVFARPEMLPTEGEGIFFLDELNRGSTSVMNAVMQLLTDRKIGTTYKLPDGWVIVTAINPDGSESYDVNTMDAALRNRVMMYDVKFNSRSFIEYARKKNWSSSVVNYVASGDWVYKEPGQGDDHYIAPRNWEYLSDAENAGAQSNADIHHEICLSLLGKNIGTTYWNYCHKTRPVTLDEINTEYAAAGKDKTKIETLDSIQRLRKYADSRKTGSYRADLINVTITTFLAKADKVDQHVFAHILSFIPVDQATTVLQQMSMKQTDPATWIGRFKSSFPDVFQRLRTTIKEEGAKQGV